MSYVRVKGDRDFSQLDAEVQTELRPLMVAAVGEAVDYAYGEVVAALSRPGPSAPGEALGMRTGEYVKSIRKSKPTGRAKRTQRAAVYTRLFWATVWEHGGRIGKGLVRVQPRPVWRPVFERIESRVDRILRDSVGA